jgi:hypothetical protein
VYKHWDLTPRKVRAKEAEVLARWKELQVVNLEEGVGEEHLEQLTGVVAEVLRVNHVPKQNVRPGQQLMAEPGEGEVSIVKVPVGEGVPGRRGLLVQVAGDRMVFLTQAEAEVCPELGVEGVRGVAAHLGPL